jgi:hypothetical protein
MNSHSVPGMGFCPGKEKTEFEWIHHWSATAEKNNIQSVNDLWMGYVWSAWCLTLLFRKFITKQPILCTKIDVCISKTRELPGASHPGPPTGLCPGPTGGLKAAPRPPALLFLSGYAPGCYMYMAFAFDLWHWKTIHLFLSQYGYQIN